MIFTGTELWFISGLPLLALIEKDFGSMTDLAQYLVLNYYHFHLLNVK